MTQASWQKKVLETEEGRKLLSEERLLVSATDLILRLMAQEKVSRKELATRLDLSPGRITQLLRGEANMTLRTLASIFHVLHRTLVLGAVDDVGRCLDQFGEVITERVVRHNEG